MEPKEKCGVFAVTGSHDTARTTYFGLFALQHRGQEATGILTNEGDFHKGLGLVTHVYDEQIIDSLSGTSAIGHDRYGTSHKGNGYHIQPVFNPGDLCGLAHNGNLPVTDKLQSYLEDAQVDTRILNDSEMMQAAVNVKMIQGKTIEEAVRECYEMFTGAFSLVAIGDDKVVACRDRFGIRPLSFGTLNGGYVVSSETCGLDVVSADYEGDVMPGEMVVIEGNKFKRDQIAEGKRMLDIFEIIYFSRPDSVLYGQRVDTMRKEMGRNLFEQSPINADLVVGVPDSAIPAAFGYAQASGIDYDPTALTKNRYIHRTFIEPPTRNRGQMVQMKLIPNVDVIRREKGGLIDHSIVRGSTSGQIVRMLRSAGAKEVHMRIHSPPVRYPDFYGVDTPIQSDLIAANKSINQIRDLIGVDSLDFLRMEEVINATGKREEDFYTGQFTGVYPIWPGEENMRKIRRIG